VLHCTWITCLEMILVPRLFHRGEQMRQDKALRLYSSLLNVVLHLDAVLPFMPVGYAVLVRKSSLEPAG